MQDHIIFAYALVAPDRSERLTGDTEIAEALRHDRPAWLHLRADHPETDPWIDRHLAFLDPSIRDALTEAETRPRCLRIGEGLLVILRGINTNPGEDPEDMVSLRLYADPGRVVSLSRRPIDAVDAIAETVRDGSGPGTTGALLGDLVERLTDLIEAQAADLEVRADGLEQAAIAEPLSVPRAEVSDQRLELTELRRFTGPQRDAVRDLARVPVPWLSEADQTKLGEQADQMTRVAETLDAVREQLLTIRDEIEAARDEKLNRNLYVLSVISAVFLPLGFLTGLMGINLAGMPGAGWPPAFWVFTGGLVAVTVFVLAVLKAMRIL
jgi:zinc transporter